MGVTACIVEFADLYNASQERATSREAKESRFLAAWRVVNSACKGIKATPLPCAICSIISLSNRTAAIRMLPGSASGDTETRRNRFRPVASPDQLLGRLARKGRIAVARNACRCRCAHHSPPSSCDKVDDKHRKCNI